MTQTRAPKSMEGIFRDIQANRQDAKRYVPVALKKDGTPGKEDAMMVRLHARKSIDEARERAEYLMNVNPGREYVVIDRRTGSVA